MLEPPLNPKEVAIIKALYAANKALPTNQVADKANMSWNTAENYLIKLYHRGITLFGIEPGNKKILWFLKTDNKEERFRFGLSDKER